MCAAQATGFFVQKPCDEYWNAGMDNYVIEAGPVDVSENGLPAWAKTEAFVRENLKVIHPKDFACPYVKKSLWVECSGPSRKLGCEEYVALYHSLNPGRPLPKGWKAHQSSIKSI